MTTCWRPSALRSLQEPVKGSEDDIGAFGDLLADPLELSLRTVGDRLGLSGERVRQIERRALNKLAAVAAGEAEGAAG